MTNLNVLLIISNSLVPYKKSIYSILIKMSNFIYFVLSLILIYLPNSSLVNKTLPPCNKLFVPKQPDTKSNGGLLYQEIDEVASKKIKFFEYVGNLKHLERSGWVMNKIHKPETVAGHMHRMSLIAMMLDEDELKETYGDSFDLNKVIKMTLIHDLAESITGDYTPYDKISKKDKEKLEIEAMKHISSFLPARQSDLLNDLFSEYENRKTPESKITKEIDRLDLILQAFEYEQSEFKRTGKLPDFEEFFDFNFVLSKIHNQQLKEIVSSLMKNRSAFLKSVCSNNVENSLDEDKVD